MVRLLVVRDLAGRAQAVPAEESWELTDAGWKLRIAPVDQQLAKLASIQRAPLPERLDVFPKLMRFYAVAPQQPGVLVIRNGLKVSLEIVDLQVDSTHFRIAEFVRQVAARSVARIPIRYTGQDEEPNLKSQLRLQVRIGEEIRKFPVPILYNYTDPVMDMIREKGRQVGVEKEEK